MDKTTDKSDAWIAEVCRKNPIQRIKTPAGEATGNIRTCPVRLSFPKLFTPEYPMGSATDDNGNQRKKKFSTALLFPPQADLNGFKGEIEALAKASFPKYPVSALHLPLRDCAEKPNLTGYEPGWTFTTVSTEYKPHVVDRNMTPIVEESRVYAGVWAVCSINLFTFDAKLKRGVSIGLQSVMIVADDIKLGGSSSDVNVDLAGVHIEAPTDVSALM